MQIVCLFVCLQSNKEIKVINGEWLISYFNDYYYCKTLTSDFPVCLWVFVQVNGWK